MIAFLVFMVSLGGKKDEVLGFMATVGSLAWTLHFPLILMFEICL